jgi:hypothetical protein
VRYLLIGLGLVAAVAGGAMLGAWYVANMPPLPWGIQP